MASVSPQGERAVLALLAEQYAEIIELRLALAAEQQQRAAAQAALDELRATVLDDAEVPSSPAV